MSLINQMLRDLAQRQDRQPAAPPPAPLKWQPPRRRRFSVPGLLSSLPPVIWVVLGGLVGLVLLWGAGSWLANVFAPQAPETVAKPSSELVAGVNAPSPAAPAEKRRVPAVPADVPPPAPPQVYGSSVPTGGVPVEKPMAAPAPAPAASATALPAPAAAPAVSPAVLPRVASTYFSDQPLPVRAPAPARQADSPPGSRAVAPAPSPGAGKAITSPASLHPDLLPGAVNATNLALQKAAREAAAVPPVVTPYGQAEAAYREGHRAYEANRTEASLAALGKALDYYPGHLPARELLVDQLEMSGRIDEAYAALKQGLAIAPDYTPFRKRAARMLLDRSDTAGALRVLVGSGLPRVAADPELHHLLAGIYLRLGENFLAAQTYRNLLVYDPRDGSAWVGLGDALAADGQAAEARKAYRKALAAGGLDREQNSHVRTRLSAN